MARGARQLEELAHDLRVAGSPRGLTLRLRRNIRAAVEPMKNEAKANVLAIPVKRNRGLRAAIAHSIVVRSRLTGRAIAVTIKADRTRMPPGQQNLPYYMEGWSRWRHPVFGDDEVWVQQDPHPYFKPAIEHHLPDVQAAVLAAVEETATQLTRGGF